MSGSTLQVFARALRFVAPLRARFAAKVAFTILSIVPLLLLPVPIKLLIDQVIGGLPLGPQIDSYPFLARPVLRMLVDFSPEGILLFTVAAQAVMLVLIGQIGSDGGERDRTDAWLSAGVDNATSTENAANAGFSFVGGLYGLFEFGWTLRLTQDLNHAFRSRLFERIQSLPLSRLDDERIGDAVYDVRHAVDHRDVLLILLVSTAAGSDGSTRTRSGQLPRGAARVTRWASGRSRSRRPAVRGPARAGCAAAAPAHGTSRSRRASRTSSRSRARAASRASALRPREHRSPAPSRRSSRHAAGAARWCRACWSCAARSSRWWTSPSGRSARRRVAPR